MIWGMMGNTKLLVEEFEKLGGDYHVTRIIRNDHDEFYPKLTS